MAFDSNTRNKLQRMVAACRDLLTGEFEDQLQERYGIYPTDGRVLDIDKLPVQDDETVAVARLLRSRISHLMAGNTVSLPDAVRRVLREQAFTVLNRFAALRMAEERGLIPESIAGGVTSKGAQVFADLAGPGLGGAYERYRVYLDRLLDELALDLRVLFDRFSPLGLLFPCENVLTELLAAINASDIAQVWAADEAIGWIYQYYNDEVERKRMRNESSAPRNSRELAVRNQFFTPRYVVEFLTDNTLGRIWYEMCRGKTRLAEQCRYMVRRPKEIFLAEGEALPENCDLKTENLSQEELLQQPADIPHRPIKDPREIRILDPACGSMHFGLYAFDLFETIYEEAWDNGSCPALQEAYASRDEFLRDVPRLIIEHNIHGIDIDPRAVQIAGLSLWLRAQRAWKEQNVTALDRPTIRKSNIVCAEPMPGDEKLLGEFADSLQPRFLGQIVRQVWKSMQLAGEAGSLLKIEEEIADWVKEAKRQWTAMPKGEQLSLFESPAKYGRKQKELDLDLSGITDAAFWEEAEERIYDALRNYAEQGESKSYQRQLFAEDAAQGFAFIDLCRKRYDVVVMNPPFGECSLLVREFIEKAWPDSKSDLFAAFFERGIEVIEKLGLVGALTSRLGLFVSSLERWRTKCLFSDHKLRVLADLGHNVLDNALVEAAAYVSQYTGNNVGDVQFWAAGLLDAKSKDTGLYQAINGSSGCAKIGHLHSLARVPGKAFAYWLPEEFLSKVLQHPGMRASSTEAWVGLQTDDDFRFLRLTWEYPVQTPTTSWRFFAKGGEYSPFYDDFHLVVNWRNDAAELRAFIERKYSWTKRASSAGLYGRCGLTYPERTTSEFSLRPLPEGTIFSIAGPAIIPASKVAGLAILGLAYTRIYRIILEMFIGSGDAVHSGSAARHYKAGVLNQFPVPSLDSAQGQELADCAIGCIKAAMAEWTPDETSRLFHGLPALNVASLMEISAANLSKKESAIVVLETQTSRADSLANRLYGLDDDEDSILRNNYGIHPSSLSGQVSTTVVTQQMELSIDKLVDDVAAQCGFSRQTTKLSFWTDRRYEAIALLNGASVTKVVDARRASGIIPSWFIRRDAENWISFLFGTVFGRWDIRYATGEWPAPELPDPFAPLQVCPPGMLQGNDGLPAAPGNVPASYPVRITWPGLLVDDPAHPEDIERRVSEVLDVLFPARADAIANEACALLGVKSLREWFRKPSGFFADHLKRYSKSRRQAPIYWPLSTASGRYTLWIYYHRLTDQTLFQCVTDFIKPKIVEVESDLARLRTDEGPRTQIDEMMEFLAELTGFRDELLRIAALPWKPNLNDGVLITASPLWKLFRLPKWQKDLKACWQELEKGDYDWSHLAYTIWPDRVKRACETDRSLAIAHGLEHLCKVEAPKAKGKRSKKKYENEMPEEK